MYGIMCRRPRKYCLLFAMARVDNTFSIDSTNITKSATRICRDEYLIYQVINNLSNYSIFTIIFCQKLFKIYKKRITFCLVFLLKLKIDKEKSRSENRHEAKRCVCQ